MLLSPQEITSLLAQPTLWNWVSSVIRVKEITLPPSQTVSSIISKCNACFKLGSYYWNAQQHHLSNSWCIYAMGGIFVTRRQKEPHLDGCAMGRQLFSPSLFRGPENKKKQLVKQKENKGIWKNARSMHAAVPGILSTLEKQIYANSRLVARGPSIPVNPSSSKCEIPSPRRLTLKTVVRKCSAFPHGPAEPAPASRHPRARTRGRKGSLSPPPAGPASPGLPGIAASAAGISPATRTAPDPRHPARARTHCPVVVHPQKVSVEDLHGGGGAGVHEGPLEDVGERRALRGAHRGGGGLDGRGLGAATPRAASLGAAGDFLELPFPHPLVGLSSPGVVGRGEGGRLPRTLCLPAGCRGGERGAPGPSPFPPLMHSSQGCALLRARDTNDGRDARWVLGSLFLPGKRWKIRQCVW